MLGLLLLQQRQTQCCLKHKHQHTRGSVKVSTPQMFSGIIFERLIDVTTLKCQSPAVLHSSVNSGQINILKDKIIIAQGFDSSGLMTWPLKCHFSQHFFFLTFRRKSPVIHMSHWKKQIPSAWSLNSFNGPTPRHMWTDGQRCCTSISVYVFTIV